MVVAVASRRSLELWASWVVFALLLMPLIGQRQWLFVACVAGSALVLSLLTGTASARSTEASAARDLLVIAAFYVAVVAAMRVAFVGFGTDRIPGLFLSFAAALLLGVVGPVVYTVWVRGGSLGDLGLRRDNWQTTAVLAVLFAAVQFAITLRGYALPAPVDWVPLLVMALVVGVFETIFFRGFIQNRLEARFGSQIGIGGAAVLYGAYHVGYGMGLIDIAFLTGLGITYAVAFSLTRNAFVLWPLLTPLGSFYAQMKNGDITLPWASIMGFADIAMIMVATFWIAHRHETKRLTAAPRSPSSNLHQSRT
jgi:membrane protease YdiL (CAAX protease family)